jgi:hypothetical protein
MVARWWSTWKGHSEQLFIRRWHLQSLFASRVSGLPAATRDLLLLAALDGTGDLGVLKGAAAGQQRGIEHLARRNGRGWCRSMRAPADWCFVIR